MDMLRKYQDGLSSIAIFSFSLVLFTWGLAAQEIIGFDSRFYLFAQEMWRHGPSIFPMSYHSPYPDYPGTSTLLIYLAAKLLGEMNKFAAVLPTAIAASLTLVMTYLIGALQLKRWGWYAVFFLLFTFTFIKSARSITLDIYPMLLTSICFYLLSTEAQSPKRVNWVYPLMLVSFAFRGPIGLVLPAGVVCSYYLLDRRYKKCFQSSMIAFCLLIAATCFFIGTAYYVNGSVFAEQVLRMEVLGRLNNNPVSTYFYWWDSLLNYALSFPFAALVFVGVLFGWIAHRSSLPAQSFLLHLLLWTFVILIGMSIPGDKKTRYVLAMMPAVALLAAYPFVVSINQVYFKRLNHLFRYILNSTVLALMVLTGLICWYVRHTHLNLTVNYEHLICILIAGQLALFLIDYFIRENTWRETSSFAIVAMAFVITYLYLIEPIELYVERANQFVVQIEDQRMREGAALVFYQEKKDYLPIKYLINAKQEASPAFIFKPEDLNNFDEATFFVTRESHFYALPADVQSHYHLIAQDTLGHVRVVVFKRNQA